MAVAAGLNVVEGLTDGQIVALFGIYQAIDYQSLSEEAQWLSEPEKKMKMR